MTHFHSDHLGSTTRLSTTARYLPFGGYRTTPTANLTDRGYTGHLHNDSIGLVYMNARYYLPGLGRFASADTIVPDPIDPQNFNRYSYTQNNPLNYTDPTGHCRYNANGEFEYNTDCTVEEFNQLSWEDRLTWMQLFMQDSGVDWFDNIIGILAYFSQDRYFQVDNGWASYADAGVLQAIQDGWRIFNDEDPIGHIVFDGDGTSWTHSGNLWANFFQLHEERFSEKNAGVSFDTVFSAWGVAEQAGVDYGILLAQSRYQRANIAEQIQIYTFVGFGNIYRGIVSDGIFGIHRISGVTDPRNSGDFTRNFGSLVVSPLSVALTMEVTNPYASSFPP